MSDATHTLATAVGDMLATEKRLRVPFDAQLNDAGFKEFQDTLDLVTRLTATTDQHIASLESALASLGGGEAVQVKQAVTRVEGAVTGLIEKVLETTVSKALRDDYAALTSAVVNYEELLATAKAREDTKVAAIAQRHLEDYTGILEELGACIQAVVLREDKQRR